MFDLPFTLPVLALACLALAGLCVLWVVRFRLEVARSKRRRTLQLAARLHSELLLELGRLESRNRVLRLRTSGASGLMRVGPLRPLLGHDLIEDLHEQMISDVRARTEEVYRGLKYQRGSYLESRCRTLEKIAGEVRSLANEIDDRPIAWAAEAMPRQVSGRRLHRLAQAA